MVLPLPSPILSCKCSCHGAGLLRLSKRQKRASRKHGCMNVGAAHVDVELAVGRLVEDAGVALHGPLVQPEHDLWEGVQVQACLPQHQRQHLRHTRHGSGQAQSALCFLMYLTAGPEVCRGGPACLSISTCSVSGEHAHQQCQSRWWHTQFHQQFVCCLHSILGQTLLRLKKRKVTKGVPKHSWCRVAIAGE
jgi:hypothetical protein